MARIIIDFGSDPSEDLEAKVTFDPALPTSLTHEMKEAISKLCGAMIQNALDQHTKTTG
jgi:hypothetical protein